MNAEEAVVSALIVDDQELVRSGLALILREKHGTNPMSSSWIYG
jgi:hypothetical protein